MRAPHSALPAYNLDERKVTDDQRRRGRLVVILSHDQAVAQVGASYPLQPLTSLGRAPTNTVVLRDTFCSQEHAILTRRGGQWWLEDRNSSNGTRLNGDLILEPVVVSSGDVVGIGQVELKIELE